MTTRRGLIALGVIAISLAACAVGPATPRGIALAEPRVRHEGGVAIYTRMGEIPAPMRALGRVEIANDGRERAAIERALAQSAARMGANAILLDSRNRWALGTAYPLDAPDGFDPSRVSRATAILALPGEATATHPAG
ncbi:hypothetical protein KZ810_04705 [Sphingomonas sp. RHCKR47]|uniref:hypothetical protein n=1 Tax=Sphingomonas citricola TaxID=2862498 RepID=UPI001CA4759C|nr:hypothetical protein [Sphingomonas citricola]MBW6522791.1 hypothetical protein [Sphingomonas citricola]